MRRGFSRKGPNRFRLPPSLILTVMDRPELRP